MNLFRTSLAILILTAAAFAQNNIQEIVSRVDRHYNDLHTLQTGFTEIYSGAGISRTESGILWLQRPGLMRWEYKQPREKLFISDGKWAWFYVPGEKQARKMQLNKIDDLRTPLAYLLGRTKLEKEFANLSLAPDIQVLTPGNTVLRGIPRRMSDQISNVVMEITPNGHFERIIAHQVDGSTTEFRFSIPKENVSVARGLFRFSPPPGVEIIQDERF